MSPGRAYCRQASQEALNTLSFASLAPPPCKRFFAACCSFLVLNTILLRPELTAKAFYSTRQSLGLALSLKQQMQAHRHHSPPQPTELRGLCMRTNKMRAGLRAGNRPRQGPRRPQAQRAAMASARRSFLLLHGLQPPRPHHAPALPGHASIQGKAALAPHAQPGALARTKKPGPAARQAPGMSCVAQRSGTSRP